MQLLRSDPAGAERRRGGSLVREKGGAEELTSEQDSFSALNYQQFLREKTFICAKSAVRLFSGFTNTPSTLTLCCTAETHSQPFVTSSFNDVPEEKKMEFSPAPTFQHCSWIFQRHVSCVSWSKTWLHQHFILIIVQWWQSRAGENQSPLAPSPTSPNLVWSCQPSRWWENIGCTS